ncbi:MAG: hypothetical protein N2747_05310 [Chitinophagaceae bacterium]|nr:hypothetical protein [Chitinophagaceae bacterium]
MSDAAATPLTNPYPTQSGTGIDADGSFPTGGNDANGGVCVFACTQILYDNNLPHNATTRHYFGDLILSFNRYVGQPVIHLAGLGGAYRYCPAGSNPADLNNWLATYFTTELELVGPFTMTKMSGNQFLGISGNFIVNTNTVNPNGESVDMGTPPPGTFNNFGAATGSIRINGPATNQLRFRVYVRGASGSQFAWSVLGSQLEQGLRNPLTGDTWYISVSLKQAQLVPLPATGLQLSASLQNNDVHLNWKTLSEVDTKEFIVERSTDGIQFAAIASKPATGNSISPVNYSLVDANMQVPVYYYRIKLIDNDGKFSYSNVALVRK